MKLAERLRAQMESLAKRVFPMFELRKIAPPNGVHDARSYLIHLTTDPDQGNQISGKSIYEAYLVLNATVQGVIGGPVTRGSDHLDFKAYGPFEDEVKLALET